MSRSRFFVYRPLCGAPCGPLWCSSARFCTFSSFARSVFLVDRAFDHGSPRRLARLYVRPRWDAGENVEEGTRAYATGREEGATLQDEVHAVADLFIGEWSAWPPPTRTLASFLSGSSHFTFHARDTVPVRRDGGGKRSSSTMGDSWDLLSPQGLAHPRIPSPIASFSPASSAVARHVFFLWQSAVFRSLLSLLPFPPTLTQHKKNDKGKRREGKSGTWEWKDPMPPSPSLGSDASTMTGTRSPLSSSSSSWTSIHRGATFFAFPIIPIAHVLLHSSLENGYDWTLWRPLPRTSHPAAHEREVPMPLRRPTEEQAAGKEATLDRRASRMVWSGSDMACEANLRAILTRLLPCLLEATPSCGTTHPPLQDTMSSGASRVSVSPPLLLHSEDVEQLEDMLLLSLLLPSSSSTTGRIVARLQRDFSESAEDGLHSNNTNTNEEDAEAKVLCYYFRHLRSSPLSLSFATSLLSLPLVPTSLLQCILYRMIHDFFATCLQSGPTMSVSQSASLTATMFTAIVHALLNNDLFFTSPAPTHTMEDEDEEEEKEKVNENVSPSSPHPTEPTASSASFFFMSLHRLLLLDVFHAIPLWSSLPSRRIAHYDYYAYTRPMPLSWTTTASQGGGAGMRDDGGKREACDRAPWQKKKRTPTGMALHTRRAMEEGEDENAPPSSLLSSSSLDVDLEETSRMASFFPKDGRSASGDAAPSSTFFRIFARQVRWIPLLHKLCRLYTKNGRGLELVACQQALLGAVPQVEVQWPCSFYGRVMGAVLDSGRQPKKKKKEKSVEKKDDIAKMEENGKGEVETKEGQTRECHLVRSSSSAEACESAVEWRLIQTLAQRAVALYGSSCAPPPPPHSVGRPLFRRGSRSNAADMNRIWIILCKAALTLPPLSCSGYRLLEAYLCMIPPTSCTESPRSSSSSTMPSSSFFSSHSTGSRSIPWRTPLTTVEEGGLQQLMRLVRGELHRLASLPTSASEEIVTKLQQLFHLLIPFMVAYTPSPHAHDAVMSPPRSSAPAVQFVWWRDWWLENGGFLLSDLRKCCVARGSTDVEEEEEGHPHDHKKVMEAGRHIAQWFVTTVEQWFQEPFSLAADRGTTAASILSAHAVWGPTMHAWLDHVPTDPERSVGVAPEGPPSPLPMAEGVGETGGHADRMPPARPMAPQEMGTSPSSALSLPTTSDHAAPSLTSAGSPHLVHCLLCGTALLPCWMPPASTLHAGVSHAEGDHTGTPEDRKEAVSFDAARRTLADPLPGASLSGQLIFHCGRFQYCTEYDSFCCACEESGGQPQVGYHCSYCLFPRPELRPLRHGTRSSVTPFLHGEEEAPYYCWQCVREENDDGEEEEEEEASVDDMVFHGPFTTFSFLRPAKQCGQWNYSWVPRCVKCGEARIKSSREPRARAGIISRGSVTRISSLFTEHERSDGHCRFRKESGAKEKEERTTEEVGATDSFSTPCSVLFSPCCPECGLPHASYQCPLFWDND